MRSWRIIKFIPINHPGNKATMMPLHCWHHNQKVMLKLNRQRGGQIIVAVWSMQLINHMALQLWAGRKQKGWQPFGDWHLVAASPFFFCSSLSAHFHPSIPSLFNWLSVKVLLSASTCPCHHKQRQPRDTALSLFSLVSATFSSLSSSLTFIFSSLDFLFPFSPSLPCTAPYSLLLSPCFSLIKISFLVFPSSWPYDKYIYIYTHTPCQLAAFNI